MNRKPQTITLIAGCILLIGAIGYSVFQSNKVYDTYGQKSSSVTMTNVSIAAYSR